MPSVVIDYLPACAEHYRNEYAIVAIDVIRATTTATTALSLGRDVYPVQTTDEAFVLASKLDRPLLMGEQGGNVPYGFDLTNSPVQAMALTAIPSGDFTDISRPIILLSSSGTRLLMNSVGAGTEAVYISCARNFSAMAKYLIGLHDKVAILGAGTRGEFRREDQMGCAWVAEKLVESGYEMETNRTRDLIKRWSGATLDDARGGRSADYLQRSGQMHDLEFVLHHHDDLDIVPQLINGKLTVVAGNITK
ncbi:MAG: 2-phosphosulfolactate phosphatase [Thiohalomonadales bacterium]